MQLIVNTPPFYLSNEQPCDYLPNRQAQSLFAAPEAPLNVTLYSRLIAHGFRRSGSMVYRPHCSRCIACVPIRIPVHRFEASRIQRRTLRRNADLRIIAKPAEFDEEHYALYRRYLEARHPEGQMVHSSPDDYIHFLTSPWCTTVFYEFRLKGSLVALAVVDHLDHALSAVYTAFEPSMAARSLGAYAVLWQIRHAEKLSFRWLYLGFWIHSCRKMAYKNQFRPLEAYLNGHWRTFEKGENMV